MTDYYKYCEGGVQCNETYVQVEENVRLRVLSFIPSYENKNVPVLIIGGLSTIVDSFGDVIRELSRVFPVYFIETRDRPTSKISGKVRFDIEIMAQDIIQIVNFLEIPDRKYAFVGYSFGASIVAQSFTELSSKPRCIIFMEPTPEFHYPAWGLFLIRWLGGWLYKILKPFAKWYLRHFYINTVEDNEMALISGKSLDNADPYKLRQSILAIAPYKVWSSLKQVSCPCLVVGTSKDRLHVPEDINKMVDTLGSCKYVDMETNLRTHSIEMGQLICSYINSCGDN